jgi:hypothetical protein
MGHGKESGRQGRGLVALEEIGQLTVSMGMVWRKARHSAQGATTPSKGLLFAITAEGGPWR